LAARERNVAMTFQFYALYPSLTVAENLAYPLHADGLSRAQIRERIAQVGRVLDLEGILDRRPHQLGEGEKQRVAVGRSIVRQPTCFLFDEPLSRLDIQLRQQMRTQIKEVLEKLDKPTVIVTHDQIEALTMADRIAVMRAGRIEQVATPHDLFAHPVNTFVAGFIGTPQMNLIEATLLGAAPGADGMTRAHFHVLGEDFAAPVEPGVQRLPANGKVTLGIRPRSFVPAAPAGEEVLRARVDLIEPMGAEMLLHLVQQDTDLRCVVPHTTRIGIGAAVGLRCKPGQLHVFDAEGGLVT
ncbi:MAG TPA: ATP-binding cassette domain-containing protein, partial [Acetobacteraceae bacterium]|nr:ATP-binding cassette domain-containing protein [Acetobacteraceae bacterium]